MRHLSNYLILCTVLFIFGCTDKSQEEITSTFNAYKDAAINSRGSIAAELVTNSTIKQYDEYIQLSKTAAKWKLNDLSFVNRFQVIMLRHMMPKELILSYNGKQTIEYSIDNGWIGKESLVKTEVGEIIVNGNRATAQILMGGKQTGLTYSFIKEEGAWKFDLTSLIKASNIIFKATAQKIGLDENDFIFSICESMSGHKVKKSIWHPLI